VRRNLFGGSLEPALLWLKRTRKSTGSNKWRFLRDSKSNCKDGEKERIPHRLHRGDGRDGKEIRKRYRGKMDGGEENDLV